MAELARGRDESVRRVCRVKNKRGEKRTARGLEEKALEGFDRIENR